MKKQEKTQIYKIRKRTKISRNKGRFWALK